MPTVIVTHLENPSAGDKSSPKRQKKLDSARKNIAPDKSFFYERIYCKP